MGETPEQKARRLIDHLLKEAGWAIQDLTRINLAAGRGVAVREFPTTTGPADYLLFVDKQAVGVIEAKKAGTTLTGVEQQTRRYADGSDYAQYGRVIGTMDPTSSHNGSSRTFRASQGLGGKTGNAAYRSYPRRALLATRFSSLRKGTTSSVPALLVGALRSSEGPRTTLMRNQGPSQPESPMLVQFGDRPRPAEFPSR